MSDKVRVLRVIEYVGDREWVETTLKQGINGTKEFFSDFNGIKCKNIIKSAIIDSFPEILDKENNNVDISIQEGYYWLNCKNKN
jgi:hypothetical protein